MPKDFYASLVSATFAHNPGIVYVLPESGSASALFGIRPPRAVASAALQARSAP